MNPLKEFYLLTTRLVELLKAVSTDNREASIVEVEKLLNERELLLKQIKPPFSEGETELGRHLVILNKELDDLLQTVKASLQSDINILQKKKQSEKKYRNPYAALQTDGVFYDKRK
ncbi:flagellar protein FliT [Bacillus kwashiorkori]|uniref:flagellar protein FliT n=1 Tax=Bacillus kwashiorkori TaxID=1522318 RepID=UPI00078147F7|nr:flagellar protein FliT [Bacillus kwashiorkori]